MCLGVSSYCDVCLNWPCAGVGGATSCVNTPSLYSLCLILYCHVCSWLPLVTLAYFGGRRSPRLPPQTRVPKVSAEAMSLFCLNLPSASTGNRRQLSPVHFDQRRHVINEPKHLSKRPSCTCLLFPTCLFVRWGPRGRGAEVPKGRRGSSQVVLPSSPNVPGEMLEVKGQTGSCEKQDKCGFTVSIIHHGHMTGTGPGSFNTRLLSSRTSEEEMEPVPRRTFGRKLIFTSGYRDLPLPPP